MTDSVLSVAVIGRLWHWLDQVFLICFRSLSHSVVFFYCYGNKSKFEYLSSAEKEQQVNMTRNAALADHRPITVNSEIFARILFSRIVLKPFCDVKNLRQGDLPIYQ